MTRFTQIHAEARALDVADPLAPHRPLFVNDPGVVSYLDGNSLGKPLAASREHLAAFVDRAWGSRLIRAWDEAWMELPFTLGDRIGSVCLGAAAGQTVVADSTSVMLYKLVTAALDARPGRTHIVVDAHNFPTDRFIMQGIAAERGLTLVALDATVDATVNAGADGVQLSDVAAAVSEQTALVLLSHISYQSGHIADLPGITRIAHEVGALVLWDLCHSVGAVPIDLDRDDVDLAVGCTYKYLCGGPGAPAFGYVRADLQASISQPIQGWMGAADPFAMTDDYTAAHGMRRFLSGTPPVLAMQPMSDMIDLIESVGMSAVREKSVALTEFVIRVADLELARHGVTVASPRDAAVRGGHVTLEHPDARDLVAALWERGVIPDFRPPHGIRIGTSPLSTSFQEVATGLDELAQLLANDRTG